MCGWVGVGVLVKVEVKENTDLSSSIVDIVYPLL